MTLKITQLLVSAAKYRFKCPYLMTPGYITIHNTYNDASAMSEISYMIGNNNTVSYHYAVDDTRAVQGVLVTRNAWHAGDGGSGTGNRKSIAIEICYSKSGGTKFTQAEKNAAYLTAVLLKENGWGINRVKRHKDWSGKNCPHRTIAKGWQRFLNMVQAELNALNGKKTTSTATTSSKLTVDGSWGPATTKALQRLLGTVVDGVISRQPKKNKKYLEAASTSSWQFKSTGYKGGSAMVKALQKLIGATVDGYFGQGSVKALQTFLNKKGFSCGSVDGYMGTKTVKALQKYINSRS